MSAASSSYYLEAERVIIDPMIPPQGSAGTKLTPPPKPAILSDRHGDPATRGGRQALPEFVENAR